MLEHNFSDTGMYKDVLSILFMATHRTVCGQHLDTNAQSSFETELDLSRYTMDRYRAIIVNKTAFYSFYLPVAFGMTVGGLQDKSLLKEVEKLCIALGILFQTQDDFLDCYAPPEVLGKIGTDIEERKCSWLCCQFLLRCTPDEKEEFRQCYGIKDRSKVDHVKALYSKHKLDEVFREYEEEAYKNIKEQIRNLSHQGVSDAFSNLLDNTYKRKK
eukprot:Selendium_serpulae@DN4603_c0_g1_i1.p1